MKNLSNLVEKLKKKSEIILKKIVKKKIINKKSFQNLVKIKKKNNR